MRIAGAGLLFALFVVVVRCAALLPHHDRAIYPWTVGESPLPATFVAFGDNRQILFPEMLPLPKLGRTGSTDAERLAIIERIASLRPTFVVNTGDLVYSGSDEAAWERFDREHAPLRALKVPYYPALGNHEYWGGSSRQLESYFARFPHLQGRHWTALTCGPLRLLILDSNFDELNRNEQDKQTAWLKDELHAAETDRSILAIGLVCHSPPYTNSKIHAPDKQVKDRFLTLGRRYSKFRLFVSGHVHSYERFLVDGVQFIVTGGGGAPLTAVNADPAAFRTPPAYQGPEIRRYHFVEGTIDPARISFRVHQLQKDLSWQVIDTFEIPLR